MTADLVIRNVEIDGRGGLDVRIRHGIIAEIGQALTGPGDTVDGRGGALLPGLADHHIHVMAESAKRDSVDLSGAAGFDDLAHRLTEAAAVRPAASWIRAVGYHEAIAGILDRRRLDQLAPRHRLRVQHQTGALWTLNSAAIDALGQADWPEGVELDAFGAPTGRIWRADAWLRSRIGSEPPPLAPLGRALAAWGVTHLTDASVTTDQAAAAVLAAAVRRGDLPQHLTLMSGGRLDGPPDAAFTVGPVKILLDDHALPELDDFTGRIAAARQQGRTVAVHCVTAGELALTLAAFDAAGTRRGDRIEHGGVIPEAAIARIAAMGLTVVTQPAFIHERGDRYLKEVEAADQGDLYRCASLLAAGVAVAGSSDAPYASANPWDGVRSAMARVSRCGRSIGAQEALGARAAVALYLDQPDAPGRIPRLVKAGAGADLCLLSTPFDLAAAERFEAPPAMTLIKGRIVAMAR